MVGSGPSARMGEGGSKIDCVYKQTSVQLGKVHLIRQGGMKILGGGGTPKIFRHPKGSL